MLALSRAGTVRLLVLGLALSACGDREASPGLAERAAALAAGMNVDTLVVDGKATPVTFNEAAGSSFPIPFDVRVPMPLRVERAENAAGDAVSFKYNLPPADGIVSITALPDSTDEATARAQAKSVADSLGATAEQASAVGWALASYSSPSARGASAGRIASVRLGLHGGRYFTVTSDAAASATEDFAPRRDYLLQHWTWTDDGSALAE